MENYFLVKFFINLFRVFTNDISLRKIYFGIIELKQNG